MGCTNMAIAELVLRYTVYSGDSVDFYKAIYIIPFALSLYSLPLFPNFIFEPNLPVAVLR